MSNIELLKKIWNAVYDPEKDTKDIINEFFHKDYEQCINGISMKHADYIQHVIEQKQSVAIESFNYKYVLEKNNELFAVYYVKGKNTNHLPVEAEVIAYFRFENQQIICIHGQVRLIKGNSVDVDM